MLLTPGRGAFRDFARDLELRLAPSGDGAAGRVLGNRIEIDRGYEYWVRITLEVPLDVHLQGKLEEGGIEDHTAAQAAAEATLAGAGASTPLPLGFVSDPGARRSQWIAAFVAAMDRDAIHALTDAVAADGALGGIDVSDHQILFRLRTPADAARVRAGIVALLRAVDAAREAVSPPAWLARHAAVLERFASTRGLSFSTCAIAARGSEPAGTFVLYVDRARGRLPCSMERRLAQLDDDGRGAPRMDDLALVLHATPAAPLGVALRCQREIDAGDAAAPEPPEPTIRTKTGDAELDGVFRVWTHRGSTPRDLPAVSRALALIVDEGTATIDQGALTVLVPLPPADHSEATLQTLDQLGRMFLSMTS